MPDDVLLEAARRGELSTQAQVAAQARRMLKDARARDSLQLLFAQWGELGGIARLEKDRKLFPFFTAEAAAALAASLRATIDHLLWDGGVVVETLWTSPVAFVNARLGPFYGVPASDDALTRITLPAADRPGLLAHPGVLSLLAKPNQSDPVHRGKFVRERVLCEPLPEPPPNIDTTIPDPRPGESTRARFARHSSDPACAGCHKLIDPIGFAFEAYDAVGRLRREDNGAAIDARGEIQGGGGDAAGTFTGLAGLAEKLAASAQVRRCVAEQVLRHALAEIVAGDLRCDLDALARAPSVLEMLVAATGTTSFSTRRVSE
jgi:hypothetical protein